MSNEIRLVKLEHYKKEYERCKTNQNEKWVFINKLLNKNIGKTSELPCLEHKGQKVTNQTAIADIFNNYFANIGVQLASNLPKSEQCFTSYLQYLDNKSFSSFNFTLIESIDVLSVVESLNTKKATGYDKISVKCIKSSKLTIVPILVHIINLVIKHSEFPDCLKIARVTPLFKKGSTFSVSNYRPISILPVLSKIVEKIISEQIYSFMEENQLFSDSQFGFRKGRNTTLAINRLMEELYTNFDNGLLTQGVFLDFSKAFDTIDHYILIKKLQFYHFSDASCSLLKSYLHNRKQYVSINNSCSSFSDIKIGVPQGSILGPLLFLLFINDLAATSSKLQYILYADDTNIFSSENCIMNDELLKIKNWCIANRLILNQDKTLQILFKSNKKEVDPTNLTLNISGNYINTVKSTQFLGLFIDENISFKIHISELCTKLNLCLLIMRTVRPFLDIKTMIDIYYTFFYPHIIYGIEFWGHASKADLNRILLLQKSALRIIMKFKPRAHISSYFQQLKIMPIDMLFDYRFLILFLKTQDLTSLKPTHQYETRSTHLRAIKVKNKRGERSILSLGVKLFNKYLGGVEMGGLSVPWDGLAARVWGAPV